MAITQKLLFFIEFWPLLLFLFLQPSFLATTVFGKGAVSLMRESRTEMRRVVWPTRMETTQTFMVVFWFHNRSLLIFLGA